MKHVAPKELPLGSLASAAVLQALRYLGHGSIDAEMIARLRRRLSAKQQRELLRDARYTTGWISDIVREIAVSTRAKEESLHG